jgi:hypothetical protein
MGKLFWILLLGFCLLTVRATEDKDEENSDDDAAEEGADAGSGSDDAEEAEEAGDAAEEGESKEFQCNLKFKRIGCYADKGKKDKPLVSFMESDEDLSVNAKRGKIKGSLDKFNGELPKFACKCANDAINSGNAIFGLQNLAECWSGPDDSKYDKDGPSEDCVTFDMAKCEDGNEVCAGKKHANFMYYVDSPEHTKTADEVKEELAEDAKKEEEQKKKEQKKKLKKKKGKKAKKAKKE